jgi:hypothetical protein
MFLPEGRPPLDPRIPVCASRPWCQVRRPSASRWICVRTPCGPPWACVALHPQTSGFRLPSPKSAPPTGGAPWLRLRLALPPASTLMTYFILPSIYCTNSVAPLVVTPASTSILVDLMGSTALPGAYDRSQG